MEEVAVRAVVSWAWGLDFVPGAVGMQKGQGRGGQACPVEWGRACPSVSRRSAQAGPTADSYPAGAQPRPAGGRPKVSELATDNAGLGLAAEASAWPLQAARDT